MNIYVGNLDYQVTDEDLQAAFAKYGAVESAKVIQDRFTGRSKGFGFVEMSDSSQAEAAIKGLNGTELGGRAISVNESRPKPDGGGERRSSGSRPGGSRPSGGMGGGRPGGSRPSSGGSGGGSRNRY